MIEVNSARMGMAEEGAELIADLEREIGDTVAEYPQLEGVSTMFLTHVDTTDLSEVSYYTPYDTRSAFVEDLGLAIPASGEAASPDPEQFSGTVSAEQIDTLDDVRIIVTYGDQELVDALTGDPLLSKMPAVANGSIVLLPDTPLAISWVLEDYVALLAEAADKAA